jgi:predicted RNA-binding Zn-ribbon protein involved in translation (DUF1610 family)
MPAVEPHKTTRRSASANGSSVRSKKALCAARTYAEGRKGGRVYSALTRASQRRYGHRPVQRVCPECGLNEPSLGTFPSPNVVGAAALVWATRDRRPISSATLHCPRCGAAMTLTEELARRMRRERR